MKKMFSLPFNQIFFNTVSLVSPMPPHSCERESQAHKESFLTFKETQRSYSTYDNATTKGRLYLGSAGDFCGGHCHRSVVSAASDGTSGPQSISDYNSAGEG